MALGGVYVALVMKHLDNMHKSFAQSFVIVLVFVGSHVLYDTPISPMFVIGALIVVSATVAYNQAA